MPVDWSAVGLDAGALVVLAVATSVAAHILSEAFILGGLSRAMRTGQMAPEAATAVYARRSAQATRASYFIFMALLIALLVAPQFYSALAPWPLPHLLAANIAGIVALCITVWYIARVLVAGAFRASAAYAMIWGNRRRSAAQYFSAAGKQLLIRYIPTLALIEASTALVAFGQYTWLWLVPLAAVLGLLAHALIAPLEQRWLFPSDTLGRTPWAHLAPRVAAWSDRTGAGIGAVRLLRTGERGTAGGGLIGLWRPTLFISDNLLQAMDWRQQDALLAMLLGGGRNRVELLVTKMMYVGGEASLLAALIFTLSYVDTLEADVLRALTPILIVPLMGFATTLAFSRASIGYRFPRYTFLADRYGAELAGDPVALMVALNTLGTLRGNKAEVANRIARLDALLKQPGPRALWADLPVPSAIPFVVDGRTLTAPLDSAPPPADVPATSYPIREPVKAAPAT